MMNTVCELLSRLTLLVRVSVLSIWSSSLKTSSLLRDCFAWIEIDGQPVQVYSKDEAKDGKSDSYIEAIEGKEFVVNWADLRKSRVEDSYTVHVYVDGIK